MCKILVHIYQIKLCRIDIYRYILGTNVKILH